MNSKAIQFSHTAYPKAIADNPPMVAVKYALDSSQWAYLHWIASGPRQIAYVSITIRKERS
jgi:hypothetical protein